MTNIDKIFQAEKQRHYKLDNPDLLAFAILTQIAHEESQAQLKRQFKIGVTLCVILSIVALQAFALSSLSFNQISQTLGALITRYPLYVTVINSVLVVAVLTARRLRLF
jgi:hypothetical protein